MFAKAYELERLKLPFAIVTIIGTEGIVPRRSGRMLVAEDGSTCSTVGGHLVEEAAIKASLEAISEGKGRIIDVSTGRGSVKLMVDVVQKAKRAYIIGYGHVGQAVAKALHSVGYAIYIHDTAPVECPWAAGVRVGGNWNEVLSGLVLDKSSALVVTVHGKDEVLSRVDYAKAFYVGTMASRARIIPDKRIHTPIGLDIDAETPEEVAVSVAAEIMKCYSKASGLPGNEKRMRFIAILGDGELAAAVAIRLQNAGYDVVVSGLSAAECNPPFVPIQSAELCFHVLDDRSIPVLADDEEAIGRLKPSVIVGIGESGRGIREMAPFTVAIGPGLSSPQDADAVIDISIGEGFGSIIRNGRIENSDIAAITGYHARALAGSVLEGVDAFFSAF